MRQALARWSALGILVASVGPVFSQTRVEETTVPAGWRIFDGDQLVGGYLVDSHGKPVVFPIIGPSGEEMTRRYPIEDALPTEAKDHPHHRSMWFTHGELNEIDFWADEIKNQGDIVQRGGTAAVDPNGAAVIQTDNDWLAPDGSKVMSDTRRFTFFKSRDRRIIDVDVLLKADVSDVHFGDTKEGTFGLRVPGTMKVDAKLGGVIRSAEGLTNDDAWGKKSSWVDYSGPVGDKTVGITIHDHPSNYGYPCRWHVRTYGLFAANPFGVYHFTGEKKTDGYLLKKGSQLRFRYRVVLHDGGLDASVAEQDSEQFAK